MQRVKFDINVSQDELFKRMEKGLKYIKPYSYGGERSTYVEYAPVLVEEKKAIVPVIKYNIFKKYTNLVHGFSTRYGGVSSEHLGSLNLSFNRGDDRDRVITNNLRFAQAVGFDFNNRVFSDQVHDIKIHKVTKEDIGKGITKETDIIGIDGLVTDQTDIPLITFYADCVPLYFYDPVKGVAGLAHSGWKGTVNKIGEEMVKKMQDWYGSKPSDILCAIGPSICVDCYEVSEDVAVMFQAAYPEEELPGILFSKGNGKYQLNLHEACRVNFVNAGIANSNIAMPDLCTCCNPEVLFSHRASKGMRGNLAAVIMLKNRDN